MSDAEGRMTVGPGQERTRADNDMGRGRTRGGGGGRIMREEYDGNYYGDEVGDIDKRGMPDITGQRENSYMDRLMHYRAQIVHLQQLVQRQDIELHHYQTHMPEIAALSAKDIEEEIIKRGGDDLKGAPLPPWIARPSLMSPLLVSYDTRIQELETENKALQERLTSLDIRSHSLVEENERLSADLGRYAEAEAKRVDGGAQGDMSLGVGGSGSGPASSGASVMLQEQLGELNEINDALRKTNTILQQQLTALRGESSDLTAELEAREADLLSERQNLAAAANEIDARGRRVLELERERDATVNRLQNAINDLEVQRRAADEAMRKMGAANRKQRAAEAQAAEYKAAMGELKKALVQEQEDVDARTRGALSRARDLRSRLNATETMLEKLKQEHRALKREYADTRADCEGMLKVMDSVEKQNADYEAREQRTMALAKESREEVEQAQLERDQGAAREAQGRKEIARLLESRRNAASEAAKRQAEAVAATRLALEQRLAERDAELAALGAENSGLKHQAERAEREQRSAESALKRLTDAVQEEHCRLAEAAAEYTQRVGDAVAAREAAVAGEKKALEKLANLERSMAVEQAELAFRLRASEDTSAAYERSLAEARTEIRRLATSARASETDAANCRRDFARMRKRFQRDADKMNGRCKSAVSDANERLEAAMVENARAKQKAAALLQAQVRLSERSQKELQASLSHFERLFREQKEERRRLAERNAELEAIIEETRDQAIWTASHRGQGYHAINRLPPHNNPNVNTGGPDNAPLRAALMEAQRRAALAAGQVDELLGKAEVRIREERQRNIAGTASNSPGGDNENENGNGNGIRKKGKTKGKKGGVGAGGDGKNSAVEENKEGTASATNN